MRDMKDYAQRVMDLVSAMAEKGLDLGNEVWCVLPQGKGYAAFPGRLNHVTVECWLDGDGKPELDISLLVSNVTKSASVNDVFLARHQALGEIRDRANQEAAILAAMAKAEDSEDPLADPPESGGTNWPRAEVRTCRVCGCTDDDCSGCIERTGQPCLWVKDDLCSACQEKQP